MTVTIVVWMFILTISNQSFTVANPSWTETDCKREKVRAEQMQYPGPYSVSACFSKAVKFVEHP